MLRDFSAWRQSRGSVRKSSLDGARETVLRPRESRDPELVHRYGIAEGEELDAIGLIKRAGGEPGQFVPVVNVALASWVERASGIANAELDRLKAECRRIGVSRVSRPDLPCAAPFPFDASVLLPSRWRSVFEEQGLPGDPEAWGREYVRPIFQKVSEPYPYVACLVADGDHMGRAIDRLGSVAEHRRFSEALARFAGEARRIVEQEHRGILVYAGGDDVLAFLPLSDALSCADDLRKGFVKAMDAACASMTAEDRPTLSVGVGVGHVLESMGDLLTLGRQAERRAKGSRNTLAVLVDKRSGGTHPWQARWSEEPVRLLDEARVLLDGRLSSRKVYEIDGMLRRLPRPKDTSEGAWARLLALEVSRSLARVEGGALGPDDVGLVLNESMSYSALYEQVEAWVARMLVARTFAEAARREQRTEEVAA
jgi:CRISPR-associated protein Cmr2